MSEIKVELKSAFKGELRPLAELYKGKQVVRLNSEVIENDNLLQELENIVLTYSKPRLESQETIEKLEHRVNTLEGDKQELLTMYHTEERYNAELMERNKRLSEEIKNLQQGITRISRKQEECTHVEIHMEDSKLEVVNLVKISSEGEGIYCVKCSKCGKKF